MDRFGADLQLARERGGIGKFTGLNRLVNPQHPLQRRTRIRISRVVRGRAVRVMYLKSSIIDDLKTRRSVRPSREARLKSAYSRPPLERMLRIHQAIQAGKFPNASTLARELEVSTKSIHRDIEFMRDRLELPIEYDGSRFGYRYTEEVNAFPTVQITEGEIFALLVAEKALQQYRGTSFEKPLLSAIKKMEQSAPGHDFAEPLGDRANHFPSALAPSRF